MPHSHEVRSSRLRTWYRWLSGKSRFSEQCLCCRGPDLTTNLSNPDVIATKWQLCMLVPTHHCSHMMLHLKEKIQHASFCTFSGTFDTSENVNMCCLEFKILRCGFAQWSRIVGSSRVQEVKGDSAWKLSFSLTIRRQITNLLRATTWLTTNQISDNRQTLFTSRNIGGLDLRLFS